MRGLTWPPSRSGAHAAAIIATRPLRNTISRRVGARCCCMAPSAEDFQRAYDELHGEFLRRQGGDGEIYDEVNPRSGTEDRIRAVALRCIGSGARVLEIGAGDGRTCLSTSQTRQQGIIGGCLAVGVGAGARALGRRAGIGPGLRVWRCAPPRPARRIIRLHRERESWWNTSRSKICKPICARYIAFWPLARLSAL